MSDDAPSPKRRKAENKNLLRDLPAAQFLTMIHHFEGPKVTIIVKDQSFSLPKALLCYNSPFFERAFNSGFKEADEQKLSLTSCSLDTFKLLVQWLYTSRVVLDVESSEKKDDAESSNAKKTIDVNRRSQEISSLLEFLKLADEIQLLGPFDIIIQTIKGNIAADRSCLKPEHIRAAIDLPKGHTARELLARASVRDYALHLFKGRPRPQFCFQAELDELDSFAGDLIREIDRALESRALCCSEARRNGTHSMTDPLTSESFNW